MLWSTAGVAALFVVCFLCGCCCNRPLDTSKSAGVIELGPVMLSHQRWDQPQVGFHRYGDTLELATRRHNFGLRIAR